MFTRKPQALERVLEGRREMRTEIKGRILLLTLLLGGALLPIRVQAQISGSGGVPADPQAAATVAPAAPVPFLVFQGQVDHAAAGTGLRNFDSGTIRLRGIPPNSTVVRAFLYWAFIASGTQCPSSVSVEFEGRTIDSQHFCTGAQPCWVSGASLCTYRADVTGLMPGTTTAAVANKVINGDYQINSFPSNSAERDGRDPWLPGTTNLPKAEGATLLVVYSNSSLSSSGRVYIHNGCDAITTANATLNVSNSLSPAAPSTITAAKFTRAGADGQVGVSVNASPTSTNETTHFGGPSVNCAAAVLTQIAGDGSTRDRDSDWNGHDGGPLNQLWDTHTTDVKGLLGGSAGNYCVRYFSPSDCLNFILYVLTVR